MNDHTITYKDKSGHKCTVQNLTLRERSPREKSITKYETRGRRTVQTIDQTRLEEETLRAMMVDQPFNESMLDDRDLGGFLHQVYLAAAEDMNQNLERAVSGSHPYTAALKASSKES